MTANVFYLTYMTVVTLCAGNRPVLEQNECIFILHSLIIKLLKSALNCIIYIRGSDFTPTSAPGRQGALAEKEGPYYYHYYYN